jgi:hypothetical protein
VVSSPAPSKVRARIEAIERWQAALALEAAIGGEMNTVKKSAMPDAATSAKSIVMKNHDIQWRRRRNSAGTGNPGDCVDDWDQAESIKIEFQRMANSLARLGFKGRKEDVINLMAWEIVDTRKAIAQAAASRKEVGQDEIR